MSSNTPFGDQPGQAPGRVPEQGIPAAGQGTPTGGAPYGGAPYGPQYGGPPPGGPGQPVPGAGGSSAWSGSGGDEVGSGDPPSGGSKRGYIPWIIGLVVVALLGGGAVAVRAALGGAAGGPAEALPGSAVMFARIDVDPSADQKVQALRLANRFPSFGEETGLTNVDADVRTALFDAIKGEAPGLADVDYATDIEPWLGSKAAMAVLPDAGDDGMPGIAVAIEVTDEDAATDGITKRLAASESDAGAGFAFLGSYAVIGETQELADSFVAAAEDSSLADNEDFAADMSALGDEGVASGWASADAAEVLNGLATSMGGMVPGGMDGMGVGAATDVPFQAGSQAFALRFDERYIEIATAGSGSELDISSSDTDSTIGGLPESTLAAMSIANGGDYVQAMLDQMAAAAEQTGQDFDRLVNRFEKQTGLAVPDDFATLLGNHFTLAVDSQLGDIASPSDLRVGALLDTDTAAAQAIIDKLVAAAGGGIELASVETDGLLAVGPNEAYAGELTGGSLGDTAAFEQAVAYGLDSDVSFYLSFDALQELDLFSDSMDAEASENFSPLEAVGFSMQFTGDGESRGSFRLTFDE